MIEVPQNSPKSQLDMELCRALYQKDPERLIELVSKWLEANQLTLDRQFCVPHYLQNALYPAERQRLN
ncbi:hypothetical protein [Roseibium sp.]|uniref:hypothetical protein n=1 Tax=Roseibium sp. TaxID=1936156 RepID=UPI003B52FD1F